MSKSKSNQPAGHWPGLFLPPESIPVAEARVVIDRVTGRHGDNVKAVHCALTVLMFANSQLPHDHPEPLFGDARPSDEEAVRVLESLTAPQSGGPAGALPWAQIIAVLVPLVMEWLRRRNA